MNTASRVIWAVVAIVIILGLGWYYLSTKGAAPSATTDTTQAAGIEALFTCDAGKTADATFYEGTSTPTTASADQPPMPGGSVHLVLSDGRSMTLPQTISADGARYATADESLVFWNVGDTATIMENGTTTFVNCVGRNNQ